MTDYTVATAFTAFEREYKQGSKLVEADLACWLPDIAREAKLKELLRDSVLYVESAEPVDDKPVAEHAS